jgi:hypothetical protein
VGDWYTIGVLLGGGVGLGVILAGLLAVSTRGLVIAIVIGLALSGLLTLGFGWEESVAAAIGAVVGAVSGSVVVQGALRRGGTRLGVGGFMGLAGLMIMLLSGIPLVGYVLAVVVPLFAARVRGQQPTRFAGLRALDK